ncbi:hypothetical protein KY385_01730 [Candidatus Parcubacteria bacterium]|nr:hypothetical protein [Candidatus Parcubacteria bacterium]
MKATDENDSIQERLLRRVASHRFDLSLATSDDFTDALSYFEDQPDPTVKGVKLAQVSRRGFGSSIKNFHRTIQPKLEVDDRPELFMVADAPYIGLDALAVHSLKRGYSMGILKPTRFEQPDLPVGFMIEPADIGVNISPLAHDFPRPENALLFDEIVNTGSVRDKTLAFWGPQQPQPDFVTAHVSGSI